MRRCGASRRPERDGSPSTSISAGRRLSRARYGLFGDGAPCGAGAGAGGAKNGGTVAPGGTTGTGVLLGFSRRNSCIASPAQKLVRYCVRIVSQMRRASSFLFFPFRIYTCDSNASRRVETVRISSRDLLIGSQRFVTFTHRLQIGRHRHSCCAHELVLRKLVDESLKRRVRLSKFLFAPLRFSEQQVSISGRRAVWVAINYLLIFLSSLCTRQRRRGRRRASIGIISGTQ